LVAASGFLTAVLTAVAATSAAAQSGAVFEPEAAASTAASEAPSPDEPQTAAPADNPVLKFFAVTELTGFVDTYYSYNFNTPKTPCSSLAGISIFNCLHAFDVAHNAFSLNLAELALEKKPTMESRAGYRIDLATIGEFLHQRDILFCVDGIQTVGAFPTSVEHVDFLAADAHKWMLGPCAAGILYVRKSLQEKLTPSVYGWNNVRCPNYVAQERIVLRPDARRYEVGTANWLGLVGLHSAMEFLLEIGIDQIADELLRKRAWLVPALAAKGYTVLNAGAPTQNISAIIALHREATDLSALHQKLEQANVIVSLRADRSGRQYLRLSPHFYNTDTELHRVLEML
jgi:kynureninase